MKTLITAGLVALKDRKLLLAFSNNKQAFYLPGGKADEGETTLSALVREIREEPHPAAEIGALRYFDTAAYQEESQQVPGVIMVMRQLRQDNLID